MKRTFFRQPADRSAQAAVAAPAPASTDADVAAVLAAGNPLLSAAQPLLRALADLPAHTDAGLSRSDVQEALRRHIQLFQDLCERANLRREHILATRYCLCTALDEAAASAAWGGTSWSQNSLLVHFHQDNYGGDKVFQLIGLLANTPNEHLDVIEVIYQILCLGFSGRYGAVSDGRRKLESIRQQLLDLLTHARGAPEQALSPRWRPPRVGRLRLMWRIPLWLTVSIVGLAVVAVFGFYSYKLLRAEHELTARVIAISEMTPPAVSVLRLRQILSQEIQQGLVDVDENDQRSSVTFKGDDMFSRGAWTVNDALLPILDKAAQAIARVDGAVTVVGHSDNTPIPAGRRIASNQALSEERAAAVMERLASQGVAQRRLEVVGMGDAEPVADNKTPAGRARNRRVQIIVTY
jgi:type VI secretion system protein ImpK